METVENQEFESYVKAAHSKAANKANNPYTWFESYVKAAHSKAEELEKVCNDLFESYVKAAHSKAKIQNLK